MGAPAPRPPPHGRATVGRPTPAHPGSEPVRPGTIGPLRRPGTETPRPSDPVRRGSEAQQQVAPEQKGAEPHRAEYGGDTDAVLVPGTACRLLRHNASRSHPTTPRAGRPSAGPLARGDARRGARAPRGRRRRPGGEPPPPSRAPHRADPRESPRAWVVGRRASNARATARSESRPGVRYATASRAMRGGGAACFRRRRPARAVLPSAAPRPRAARLSLGRSRRTRRPLRPGTDRGRPAATGPTGFRHRRATRRCAPAGRRRRAPPRIGAPGLRPPVGR